MFTKRKVCRRIKGRLHPETGNYLILPGTRDNPVYTEKSVHWEKQQKNGVITR